MPRKKVYDINQCLKDIEQSINNINEFLPVERNFFVFEKDLKTRYAVERNIEIIGEAMNRILKTNPDFEISNSRRIVDVRNRFIHGYDSLSIDILWGIITHHLPVLEKEVKELLKNYNDI